MSLWHKNPFQMRRLVRKERKKVRTLEAANTALRKRVEGLEATVDAALFESLSEDATAASVRLIIAAKEEAV